MFHLEVVIFKGLSSCPSKLRVRSHKVVNDSGKGTLVLSQFLRQFWLVPKLSHVSKLLLSKERSTVGKLIGNCSNGIGVRLLL